MNAVQATSSWSDAMRERLASLALEQRRCAHQQRRWAAEAAAKGDQYQYHVHSAQAIRYWRDAKAHLRAAKGF